MGMYVSVRGWIELPPEHRADLEAAIGGHSDDPAVEGWSIPTKALGWSLCAFYGADLRESAVDGLERQVREIARLGPFGVDSDFPRGIFVLVDERRQSWR